MIVCVWLPHFAMRVIAHRRHALTEPLAVNSVAAAHPVVVDCTAAARADGVEPGMLVSRALGQCATLQVLDWDDALVHEAGERYLQRLESLGAAVHPMEPGRAFFDAAPLARMYGGAGRDDDAADTAGVVREVLRAFRSPDMRVGVGPNPFVAWVAARYASPGGHLVVVGQEARRMLADLPISLLPGDDRFFELMRALGLETLGHFALLEHAQVADRFGERGELLWKLAQGRDERRLAPRRPSEPVEEYLQFPEPVANMQTLQSAVRMLVERAVRRPQCVQHAPRTVLVVAWLATGGSWQVRRVLRTPTVDPERVTLAALVQLDEIPAPIERVCVRFEEFDLREATQQQLLHQRSRDERARVSAGVRHVQATVGDDALLQVLEVEPWSRVPERHAVLVPRHEGAADSDSGAPDPGVGRGVWE